jgi:hypothetical protein
LIFSKIFPFQNGKNFSFFFLLFCLIILFFSATELNSNLINNADAQTGYHYAPGLVMTGPNYQDVANTNSLKLSQFSIATWFKTSSNFGSDAFIVNKGGIGSDSSGHGNVNTAGQVLHLSFGSNNPPVANNQEITVNRNTQQTITLTATDSNNDPLTYTVLTLPAHGTLTGSKPNLNYNPDTDYVGTDSFTFKANDGTTDSNTATISITVQGPANDPPIANNQAITVNRNTQQTITLTATDSNNDPLTYTVLTLPAHGTLTGSKPNLNYNPDMDYVGTDSFTFKAND